MCRTSMRYTYVTCTRSVQKYVVAHSSKTKYAVEAGAKNRILPRQNSSGVSFFPLPAIVHEMRATARNGQQHVRCAAAIPPPPFNFPRSALISRALPPSLPPSIALLPSFFRQRNKEKCAALRCVRRLPLFAFLRSFANANGISDLFLSLSLSLSFGGVTIISTFGYRFCALHLASSLPLSLSIPLLGERRRFR